MRTVFSGFLLIGVLFAQIALSDDAIPNCPDLDGSALPVINAQVLDWKANEPNQYRHRAHVRGQLQTTYDDRNGHHHFEIQIGPNPDTDMLEVIYNEDFGPLPDLHFGGNVEACGDFIVSTAQAGPYPPSPAGAIIHWVHMNPSHRGHPPGYLWIDGVLCGQDAEHAGPRRIGD